MTAFQKSILVINGLFACWLILRAETILARVDRVTETANRALDAMPAMQVLLEKADHTLDKSRTIGSAAMDRIERAAKAVRKAD